MFKLKKLLLVAGTLASAVPVIALSSCNKGSSVQKIDLDLSEAEIDVYGHFADTYATYGTAYLSGFKCDKFDADNLEVEVNNLTGITASTKTTIIKNKENSQTFDIFIEFESQEVVYTKTATFDLRLINKLDRNDQVIVKDCAAFFSSYLVNVDLIKRTKSFQFINVPNEITASSGMYITQGLYEPITDITNFEFQVTPLTETALPIDFSVETVSADDGKYKINYKLSDVKTGNFEYLLKITNKLLPNWTSYFVLSFGVAIASSPFTYKLADNALSVQYINVNDAEITIPDEAEYKGTTYPVKAIDSRACSSRDFIQKVNIGKNVTNISSGAFRNCYDLKEINIPANVTSISSDAFSNCSNLTNLNVSNDNTIYSSKTSVGGTAEAGCIWEIANSKIIASTINPTIPNGITQIGPYGLAYTHLQKLELPETITSIGKYAFANSTNLKSIKFPQSITEIPTCACYYCTALETIEFGSSTQSIKGSAFNHCASLKNITIPANVTTIQTAAFEDCYSLESITLPNGLTTLGSETFGFCTSLKQITIPSTVTSIGRGITIGCYDLTSIKVEDGNTEYVSKYNDTETNSIIDISDSANHKVILGCVNSIIPEGVSTIKTGAFTMSSIKTVASPSTLETIEESAFTGSLIQTVDLSSSTSLTEIDDNVFSACLSLKSVSLPNSVTEIGDEAFYEDVSLETINIPTSLEELGKEAFYDCIPLANVTLPEGLTNLPDNCFANTSIKTITVPSTVTDIFNPFPVCNELEEIIVADGNTKYSSKDGDINCNCIYEISSNTLISGCKKTTIPSTIKTLKSYCFEGLKDLKEITIPENVTKIEQKAFLDSYLERAIFENPNNWYMGTARITDDLTDPVVAAELLNNNSELTRKDS